MSTNQSESPKPYVLVTEILDKPKWWNTLETMVTFLCAKNFVQARVEFGFVVDRDLRGLPQGSDQTVALINLASFIERGLAEGTIEWAKGSDFHFYPVGADLDVMLCNDADLHMTSADSALLTELGRKIVAIGIMVVYDSGSLL
jgi:hypothetical protein